MMMTAGKVATTARRATTTAAAAARRLSTALHEPGGDAATLADTDTARRRHEQAGDGTIAEKVLRIWGVQMENELTTKGRTWTKLKKALLRRYRERPDKSAAEWRVRRRLMVPGETFADFAAGLRDLTGVNRVRERASSTGVWTRPNDSW